MAALSATCQPSAPSVAAQAHQERVSGADSSMLEAVQALSSQIAMISNRMDSFEQGTNRRQEHQSLNVAVSVPTPLQSNLASGPRLRTSRAPFGDPDGDDEGDGDGNEDEYDDEEELMQDDSPTCEKDIVDSRALHSAKIDPIPSAAADFRLVDLIT